MAEALGFAAAVAGLASLAIQVSQISFQYVSGVRHTSKTVSTYLQELSALTSVILRIQDVVSQPQVQEGFTGNSSGLPTTSLDECSKQMQTLKNKLQRYLSDSGARARFRTLSWPLEEKETRHFIETFHRFCNTFNSIVSANTLNVASLTLQEVRNSRKDDQRREILEWLSPYRVGAKQAQVLSLRCEESVEWLLDTPQFLQWLDGREPVLWCYGSPGVGKTVLTSYVVDILDSQDRKADTTVLYHYCDYYDAKEQLTTVKIVRSLLRQLAEKSEILPREIEAFYDESQKTGRYPDQNQLVATVIVLSQRVSKTVIVIDAIDEQEDRKDLISLVKELEASCKIFVTSRPLEDINLSMKNYLSLEVMAADSDIKRYTDLRLLANEDLGDSISTQLKQEILTRVVAIAGGVFLLARLLMDNMEELVTLKEVRELLDRRTINLAQAYESTLTRINQQSKSRSKLAMQVLSWVLNCRRPLQVEELRHALAVDASDDKLEEENLPSPKLMINSCMGLVLVDHSSGQIRFAHLTVLEFLRDVHRDLFGQAQADLRIAQSCLKYLSFRPFHESRCDTQGDILENLRSYPFLDYAAGNWGEHLDKDIEVDLEDDLLALLDDRRLLQNAVYVLHYQRRSDRMTPLSAFEAIPRDFEDLHVVAYWGLSRTAEILLEERQDISAKDSHGWTPLHWASARGHGSVVQLLLAKGADIESKDRRSWTPLLWAVRRQQRAVVSRLVEKGANIHVRDINGDTILHFAVASQNTETVSMLLSGGVDVDVCNNDGETALQVAVRSGNEDILSLLKTSSDAVDDDSNPSEGELEAAADNADQTRFIRILNRLRRHKGTSSIDEVNADKLKSVQRCDLSTTFFFRYGKDELPTFLDKLLHKAILTQKPRLIRCLMNAGVNPLVKYRNGQTYLHTSTACLDGTVAATLTAKSIDPMAVDNRGRTALHYAAIAANKAVAEILINYMATIDVFDNDSQSPLHLLWLSDKDEDSDEMCDRISILQMLCAHGADINVQNEKEETALHFVIKRAKDRPVLELLRLGVDTRMKDKEGKQAIHLLAARDEESSSASLKIARHFDPLGPPKQVENLTSTREKETANLELLRAFIRESRCELSEVDSHGHTVLSIALCHANWQMASELFELGATVKSKRLLGDPLLAAIRNCDIMGLKFIYKVGAPSSLAEGKGEPVLAFAVRTLQMLLDGREDPAERILHPPSRPMHPMSTPTNEEDAEPIIRTLLEHGEDVNERNKDGTSSLQLALRSRSTASIVDMLIAAGADIHVVDKAGRGVFHDAVESGHVRYIHLLFDLRADCNRRDQAGTTPVALAAAHGYDTIVALILANETCDEVSKAESDWPATSQLIYAIEHKDNSLFHSVQNKDLSIHIQDRDGNTPLHKSSAHGNLEMVSFLLNRGARVDDRNNDGWSPLHHAAAHGHTSTIRLLAQHGADFAARTLESVHRTRLAVLHISLCSALPLHFAAANGHTAAVLAILELSLPSTEKRPRMCTTDELSINDGADSCGRTALMWAAYRGHRQVVEVLLDAGADVNAAGGQGSWGFCAIDEAAAGGHGAIVELLAERGSADEWWTNIQASNAIQMVRKKRREET